MKIIQFAAENVKKLRVVAITPKGNVVQITGPNGSGKSSVLDAIFMALAGKSAAPSKPVRDGEEKASITLDLGEIVVTRKFTKDGGTSLTVATADGAKYASPQQMLDKLLGTLTFDPLAFSRMPPKEQRTELGTLLGITAQLDKLEIERARCVTERTAESREVKSAIARRDAVLISADVLERVDVAAVMAEINHAQEENAGLHRLLNERASEEKQIRHDRERVIILREKAQDLLDEANELEQNAVQAEQMLQATVVLQQEIDIAPLRQRVLDAQNINAELDRREQRRVLDEEVQAGEKAVAHLTKCITEFETAKAALVQGAAMPIPGLGFTADGVTYNSLPLEQASSAEQLRVSVAIAMAANPKLRVLRIKDGSLLDEASLALLEEMVDAQDFQVWIERVDTSGTVGIIMEDGTAREASAAAPTELAEVA
ncbi:MAG: AAA family ATPase [Gemmatimonadota bacterium]